jgi:hypothetical protein
VWKWLFRFKVKPAGKITTLKKEKPALGPIAQLVRAVDFDLSFDAFIISYVR